MRWLRALDGSGSLGAATLAVAYRRRPGPAAGMSTRATRRRSRERVGHGLHHGISRLQSPPGLGPVRRVEAKGLIGYRLGCEADRPFADPIEVTRPTMSLIHLEFASGALGQLLASFATADTRPRGSRCTSTRCRELRRQVLGTRRAGDGLRGDSGESPADWRPGARSLPRDDSALVEAGARALHRLPARHREARSSPPSTRVTSSTSSSGPTNRSRTGGSTRSKPRSRGEPHSTDGS